MTLYRRLFLRFTVCLVCWLAGPGSGALAGKPAPRSLPEQTPMTVHGTDAEGVIVAALPDGTRVYNVFEVAMQALEGEASFRRYRDASEAGLLPRLPSPGQGLTPSQSAALRWLQDNARPLGEEGLIWYYEFDNAYNDIRIEAPWGSAFGQAHVIQAFLNAWRQTGEASYRALARRAVVAFGVPIAEGGFQYRLPDGHLFFEEVPSLPASHILNGHMVATLALHHLGRVLDDPIARSLAEEGIATLRHHLSDYDLGYWSRYDLNPRKDEIIFRLLPSRAAGEALALVDRVSLINPETGNETVLDVGAADDARGAWRISGIEWGPSVLVEDVSVRGIDFGPARHPAPVAGGSLQNAYLVMRLPDLEFPELSQVPTFWLRLDYRDDAPGWIQVEIQDASHGNFMGFRSLHGGTIRLFGDGQWRTRFVAVHPGDLAWYVGTIYQHYHVRLLEALYEATSERLFRDYALRWRTYLDQHEERNVEQGWTLPRAADE